MKKRILSLLLVIVMVAGMLPMPGHVHAVEVENPVCDCGTDDASIHATTCAVYVAPENPECWCVEKCTEANEWCDVCGFDAAACGASGEEEAVTLAAGTYISKIAVAYGAKESTPKDILRNNGFTIIDRDLNAGCGATSHYIYMGYKTTTDLSQAITGIFFRTGSNPPSSATFDGVTAYLLGGSGESNPGENKAVDLNADAGGAYIYTYVTRDAKRAPITEITFSSSNSKSGYVTPNVNLNQGAGGDSIYLHYKQWSATVTATYWYLDENGNRQKYVMTKTITRPDQTVELDKKDFPNPINYNGKTYATTNFNPEPFWRDDDQPIAANSGTTSVNLATSGKVMRMIYLSRATHGLTPD